MNTTLSMPSGITNNQNNAATSVDSTVLFVGCRAYLINNWQKCNGNQLMLEGFGRF
jgi:hypothetical protein